MKDNSGPAFPFIENDQLGQSVNVGMTKRELIAMHVLAGMRASETDVSIPRWEPHEAALRAREDADALLAELAKE